jgi:hypothetical protein
MANGRATWVNLRRRSSTCLQMNRANRTESLHQFGGPRVGMWSGCRGLMLARRPLWPPNVFRLRADRRLRIYAAIFITWILAFDSRGTPSAHRMSSTSGITRLDFMCRLMPDQYPVGSRQSASSSSALGAEGPGVRPPPRPA